MAQRKSNRLTSVLKVIVAVEMLVLVRVAILRGWHYWVAETGFTLDYSVALAGASLPGLTLPSALSGLTWTTRT